MADIKPKFDWREDLAHARDLSKREVEAYGYVLGWIEDWRVKHDLPAGREAAKRWWLEVAKTKDRPEWQLRQWQEAIRWFLAWLELCQKSGGEARSVPERLKDAVHHVGARRGLAYKTRQTYAAWLMRFGAFAVTEQKVMDIAVAREWLTLLVAQEKVAYATQKQALNALVFFYRDVCGKEEIDLQVRMRKTQRRQPVILSREEVMGLIAKLEPRYRTPALLQFGSGLRLSELVSLRIKDVDLERGVLTVHCGKGDKDRLTVIPNVLKSDLQTVIEEAREWRRLDRENQAPGVFLPGALAQRVPDLSAIARRATAEGSHRRVGSKITENTEVILNQILKTLFSVSSVFSVPQWFKKALSTRPPPFTIVAFPTSPKPLPLITPAIASYSFAGVS